MSDIYVAGVSMTRFGPQPDQSFHSLCFQAVNECLENAGALTRQVDAVYFSNAAQEVINNQHREQGEFTLQAMGFERAPVVNIANGNSSGSTAFWQAREHLRSGKSDAVMVVGIEKSTFDGSVESAVTFPDICTLRCRSHMARFGTTLRQLALISSKNHANSVVNPNCCCREPASVEEILEAQLLCYPLTLPMCAPLSDGGAATLLCTKKGLRELKGTHLPVRVDSCVKKCGNSGDCENFEIHLSRRAASGAYAQAGIGPEDIDLAEVHDATSFDELLITELLGFCEPGSGGHFIDSGASALLGRLPVNPSGGLESKGHPMGATGLAQIYELVTQLRGEAGSRQVNHALVAVQENSGTTPCTEESTSVVTVLSR